MPLCSPLPCGRANVIVGCVSDRKRSPKLLCNSTLSLSMHILPLFWLRSAASYIAAWRPYQPFFLHSERGSYDEKSKKFFANFYFFFCLKDIEKCTEFFPKFFKNYVGWHITKYCQIFENWISSPHMADPEKVIFTLKKGQRTGEPHIWARSCQIMPLFAGRDHPTLP